MFSILDHSTLRTCQGITRRELLRVGTLGLGGWTLADLLAGNAQAATPSFLRDKSVVLLFLQGGPPQIETFDPKPEAPENVRSCTGSVKTKTPGIHFGGTFPQLAKRTDQLTIVRSFASGDGGHNQLPVLTGNSPLKGTMAAHYARLAGANHPKTGMPTNTVVLPEAIQPELQLGTPTGPFTYKYIEKNYVTAGNLGQAYQGVLLGAGGELTKNLKLSLPRERLDDRRSLLKKLDNTRRAIDAGGLNDTRRQAYDVLIRGISEAFDISKEDPRTNGTVPCGPWTYDIFRRRDS